jgi:RHS repeat-associated protein
VTTQTFDAAGELTGVSFSDGTTPAVTYGYDAAGRRTSMTDATGTTGYGYDAHGNLRTVTDGSGAVVSYGWNTQHQVASVGDPDGHAVTRGYDVDGRLTSVTDWNNHTTSFGWDADGNLTAVTFPNGVTQTTTVDAADQPTAITIANTGGTLAAFGYTPDPAGLLASSTDSLEPSLSTSYGHTTLSQLSTVASATSAYGYDPAGNLTSLDDGTTQTFDPAGQLLTAASPTTGTTSFGYDPAGERVTASGATTAGYGYDQTGQLTSSDTTGGQAAYTYNGDGLRATPTNTTRAGTASNAFSWDQLTGGVPVVLSDGVNDYVYGPGDTPVEQVDQTTGATSYLHTDRIGSVRLVTDPTGAVVATASYTPYGLPIASATAATPFGFSGEYTDPTGLIYLRARYYDPATGQFLVVDPLVADTHTAYGYAGSDPLDNGDPTGRFCLGSVCTPSLQDVGDWTAGFGDTVTFGGTKQIRRLINYAQTGNTNDIGVDQCSNFYHWGAVGGDFANVFDSIALPYGAGRLLARVPGVADWAYANKFVGADSRLFGNWSLGKVRAPGTDGLLNQRANSWRIGWSVNGGHSPTLPGFRIELPPINDHNWWFHAPRF